MASLSTNAFRLYSETRFAARSIYAEALYNDPDAKLDDIREAVTTLEETERTARRVLGSAYPTTGGIERALRNARAALRASETPASSAYDVADDEADDEARSL